ncbi:MAG: hypothetical protein RMM08_10420, partial [Armatimonadota bacterium]|nr:hypothetical protein [Armatimonadota bacterium]
KEWRARLLPSRLSVMQICFNRTPHFNRGQSSTSAASTKRAAWRSITPIFQTSSGLLRRYRV